MKRNQIWHLIELEMRQAKKEYLNWPDHPAAQSGIVCKEAGYLMKASLEWKYKKAKMDKYQLELMKRAAVNTAVSAIRFLENLKSE